MSTQPGATLETGKVKREHGKGEGPRGVTAGALKGASHRKGVMGTDGGLIREG